MEERGFAHRDIKAENMTIDENFQVKLIDFGFAFRLSQRPATDSVGSGCYMAPELLQDDVSYCPLKADVFAIGVALYFFITGQYPWAEASARDNHYREI